MTPEPTITPVRRLQAALPYLVVLAAGIFLYYEAENFEFEQASGRIGPGAWPQLILVVMLATALWGGVASAIKAGQPAAIDETEAEDAEEFIRPPEIYPWMVWLAILATLGYLVLLPILGFFLSTIVYSAVLMYLGHYRRPLVVAGMSVAIAFAFMFIFMRIVYVALPLGVPPFNEISYGLMSAMGVH